MAKSTAAAAQNQRLRGSDPCASSEKVPLWRNW